MIKRFLEKYKKILMMFVAVCLVSSAILSAAVYAYMSGHQTYSASVNFRFTNTDAVNGYAMDGTALNFQEIKGAEVMKNAIDKFGREGTELSADQLSSNIEIEDVISKEEQDKIDSALKNGKEYEYHPVEFKATLTTEEKEAAWLMQCIADSYYDYYAENHMPKQRLSPIANLDKYDFIETADLLKNAILQSQDYLTTANGENPDFRCSKNGYLFSDILAEYELLYNNEIPKLYSMILLHKASKDPKLLVQTLQKKIISNETNINDTENSLEEIKSLIRSYSEKNKAESGAPSGGDNLAIDENHQNIMDSVYENDANPVATYDELFKRFNSQSDAVSTNNVDNEYYEYLISVFKDAEALNDPALEKEITDQITYIHEKMEYLHGLSLEAKAENDAIQVGTVLKQLNTPYTEPSGKAILFTALTFIAVNIMLGILLPLLWLFKQRAEEYIRENYLVY